MQLTLSKRQVPNRGLLAARVSVLLLLAVGALALGGCVDRAPEPSNLKTPNVVWPDGQPKGPFEDTEWVQAYRDAAVAEAVAWNAMDFSDPDLVESYSYETSSVAAGARKAAREKFVASGFSDVSLEKLKPGPAAFIVLDVFADEDSALLVACYEVDETNEAQPFRVVRVMEVFRMEVNAYLIDAPTRDTPANAKTSDEYRAECDAAPPITTPLFDPAPTPNLDPDAKVIFPADRDKYEYN